MSKSERKPGLLVVEDDPGLQKQLKWAFAGHEVELAGDRSEAVDAVRRLRPPVVTLDLGLPPDAANASEGMAALEEILSIAPGTKVIVVTGNDDRDNALRAIAVGAYDYYQKPVDADELSLIVQRAQRLYELEQENRRLAERQRSNALEGVIGSSPSMMKVCETVEKVAPTDTTVLLLGESGTGKELIARALHDLSERADGPFIAINCAAIPEQLLESELFGYEKGAFTGATKQTRGKLEYAQGGTLLLDEVGDLPAALQAKLLRFLQERVIERVGGRETIALDIRVICATHKELKSLAAAGEFREDLYYRISEITLSIPPLRDRPGDAVLIARALLQHHVSQGTGGAREFSRAAMQAIESYDWPGNVRELENKVKRGTIMASGKLIEPDDLELESDAPDVPLTLKDVRERAEVDAVRQALIMNDGQIGKAAETLGVSRPTIYHLIKKFNLTT